MVACVKETPLDDRVNKEAKPAVQDGNTVMLTIHDAMWTEDTKTAHTEGIGVSLTGTEMLSILYEKDKLYYTDYTKASPTGEAGKYSFVKPAASEGATRWYGIMPYSKWLIGLDGSGSSVKLRLGPVQFPQADSFDPQFDYLVARPFTVNESQAEITAFKRLFAPLCLSIKGLPDGAKIYTVTMSLSQEAGKYNSLTGLYYATVSENYDQTVITNVDGSSKGNAVSAEYGSGLSKKGDSWPVWFMVNPITINAGGTLTVSLSTQDQTYTRTVTLPSTQSLGTDVLNRITFNITGTGCTTRPSVTQDFANQTLGGTKNLTASNGNTMEWVTTTTREYRSADDGGSGVKGALMLSGNSFTFPTIEGAKIVGARVFTHPSSRSNSNVNVALTVDGTDVYPFNLASATVSETTAWTGGVVDIGLPAGKNSLAGLTVTAAAGQNHLISAITLFTESDSYTPTAEDLAVDRSLFYLLDLNYPALSYVKSLYESGKYKRAADELLAYFKDRPGVVNPAVSLPITSMPASSRKIAEDALPENGYRFAVHAGQYYESYSAGQYTYYSFDDGSGHINWEYEMPDSGTQCYQKHWHAWFLQMAQMFRYSGQEKWFEAWKAQYSDWMAHYPCPSGADPYTRNNGWNTWHALSMATRIENQTQLFEYFVSASGFDFEWLTTFMKAFHESVEYSRNHLYSNEKSNIRFAQYKSHCLAGILFPEFADAATWLDEGSTDVSTYFDIAFADDGVLIELDANYHSGEVQNFISVYKAASENGKLSSFNADFLDKLKKSCDFMADYIYPDGRWATFNDTRQQTAQVTRRWMSTFSGLYPSDNKFLYLSTAGASGIKPTDALCEYKTSGYYMFRSDWDYDGMMLIYKNNYNPDNMWHANRDNGTVGLYKSGRIFLPDAGSYTYGDGNGGSLDQARAEHQKTCNHNTVTLNLDNIGTSNSKGRYLTSYTTTYDSGNVTSLSCVVAENTSYTGLTHRRTVWLVNNAFFVIGDSVYGTATGTVNLSWHLLRDTEGSLGADVVVMDDDTANNGYGAHTVFGDGNDLLIKTYYKGLNDCTVDTGLSWCSDNFLERYQRKFYRVNVPKTSGNVRMITVLYPCSNPDDINIDTAFFMGGFSMTGETVRVRIDGKNYDMSYTTE